MKRCSTCQDTKDENAFNKNRNSPDGLQNVCKSCYKHQVKTPGRDGLTYNQRRATVVGPDGLTSNQRQELKRKPRISEDGLTRSQRDATVVGEDGLTKNQRDYLKVGKDGLTGRQRQRKNTPDAERERVLKKYNLTISDFNSMLSQQEGVCAICKRINKRWCVDHDHSTGKVRAILCSHCNLALGLLGDSPRMTNAATEYLLKHGKIN